ncbi:MAG TPA: hypothetical protein VEI80_04785 [Candidatus Acidoferrales bacterium]|nr:hypothetical protein [Candidatus Acidoferrales bacterium]
MSPSPVDYVIRIPIRRIAVVIDTQESLTPEMSLEDFRQMFGHDPDQSRYRLVNLEVITSPDDQQPMLVSECGKYGRFLRREGDNVYVRKTMG